MKFLMIFVFFFCLFVSAENEYMSIHVDATEIQRGLIVAEMEIPTNGTDMVVWYPKWIPGIHGPRGPVENIGGVYFTSDTGKTIKWNRNSSDPYRFICKVDKETKKIHIKLRYICNQPNGNSTGVDSYGNSQIGVLNWNTCILYPEVKSNQLQIQAKITMPENWKYATALKEKERESNTISFETTSLETLIDSPLICGQYLRSIPIPVEDFPPHFLHLVGESAKDIDIPSSLIDKYQSCVQQAKIMFGKAHFDSYHFLVYLSDRLPYTGLEHLASSLNGIGERDLTDEWSLKGWVGSLLPHEYVHSWCGKYRRPVGMYTPDYHTNKDTKLLWIYEGLTTYLGEVLAVRSNFLTPEEYIPRFTQKLNRLIKQVGRSWRPLEDTCTCTYTLRESSPNWGVWRRGQDYYDEGLLLWLEIDTIIRHRTFGEKSLNDFCRKFFGKDHPENILPYDLLEVYQALDSVAPYHWKTFIEERIEEVKEELPLNVVNLCGYRIVYTNKASDYLQTLQQKSKYINAIDSLGIIFGYDGQVKKIIPGMLAEKSGFGPGMQVSGINGQTFNVDNLESAIANTVITRKIEFLVFERYTYKILTVDYDGGAKHMNLERVPNSPDMLTKILSPLK